MTDIQVITPYYRSLVGTEWCVSMAILWEESGVDRQKNTCLTWWLLKYHKVVLFQSTEGHAKSWNIIYSNHIGYQCCSVQKKKCLSRLGLDLRPPACKSDTLPTELPGQSIQSIMYWSCEIHVTNTIKLIGKCLKYLKLWYQGLLASILLAILSANMNFGSKFV